VSIGLKTKIGKDIDLDHLIQDASCALREILNVSDEPPIKAYQFIGKHWTDLSRPHRLSVASPIIGFTIPGENEIASLSIYERTADRFDESDWKPEELGAIASIEVCGVRTELSYALIAAVALAIARLSGGSIADEMKFFNDSFDSSAEDFLTSIRVVERFDDYRNAAIRFERQLFRRQSRQKQVNDA
jgi:hypothetical protein